MGYLVNDESDITLIEVRIYILVSYIEGMSKRIPKLLL